MNLVWFFSGFSDFSWSDNIRNSPWTRYDFDRKSIISWVHYTAVGNNGLINKDVHCTILRNDVVKWRHMSPKDLFTNLQRTCLKQKLTSLCFHFNDGPEKKTVVMKTTLIKIIDLKWVPVLNNRCGDASVSSIVSRFDFSSGKENCCYEKIN